MADPMTILAFGVNAIGGFAQNKAVQAQYKAQAQAAEYNASIARQNAQIAEQQTQAQVENQDRERRLRLGAQIAGAGASGVGMQSFSDILSSSAAQEELDLLTLKSEGALRKREFGMQSDLLTSQASSSRSQARYARGTGIISGISSGIGSMGGRSTAPSTPRATGRDIQWVN